MAPSAKGKAPESESSETKFGFGLTWSRPASKDKPTTT